MTSSPMSQPARLALFAALTFGLLACVSNLGKRSNVSPQDWWEERGPVVRHESFPTDCSLCHVGDDWHTIRDDFFFDHERETGVRLEGAHEQAECIRCHNDRGPVASFANRGCAGCHEDVHFGKLGQDCALCHDERSWKPSDEQVLHNRTRFPLVGAHAAVACWRCHIGATVGNFAPVDVECITCHASDLARATDPDHVASGFTSNCDRCHIPTTWSGGGFNHPGFPLTGAHRALDCSECHVGGTFVGTPRDCYSCHMDDYAGARDHVSGNFPMNCEACHDTRRWDNAVFDHAGINRGCDACHLDDYVATTDPSHTAAGFPVSCNNCHSTNSWTGARFNHRFPIEGGPHGGLDCANCHLSAMNFSAFSCTHCHEHRQSEMDDEHDDVGGYVWESGACYACHPDGNE